MSAECPVQERPDPTPIGSSVLVRRAPMCSSDSDRGSVSTTPHLTVVVPWLGTSCRTLRRQVVDGGAKFVLDGGAVPGVVDRLFRCAVGLRGGGQVEVDEIVGDEVVGTLRDARTPCIDVVDDDEVAVLECFGHVACALQRRVGVIGAADEDRASASTGDLDPWIGRRREERAEVVAGRAWRVQAGCHLGEHRRVGIGLGDRGPLVGVHATDRLDHLPIIGPRAVTVVAEVDVVPPQHAGTAALLGGIEGGGHDRANC